MQVTIEVPDELIDYVRWLASYKGYRSEALAWAEVLRNGKSRVEQLRKYAEKRKDPSATFRPYAPLKLSETERGNAKRAARAEGVATIKDPFPWRCRAKSDNNERCTLIAGHLIEMPHNFKF